MPKLQISSKTTAAALCLWAAFYVAAFWFTLLTVPEPDLGFASYAFSSENEHRWFFILFTVSGIASLAAGIVVAITRRRAVLKSAFIWSIVQALALVASGAWLLAVFAGAPAWWLYRAQHEV